MDLPSLSSIISADYRILNFTYNSELGSQNFSISLGYYESSDGLENYQYSANSPEGAYLFKPSRDSSQLSYIGAHEADISLYAEIDGPLVQGYIYRYRNVGANKTAMIHVR